MNVCLYLIEAIGSHEEVDGFCSFYFPIFKTVWLFLSMTLISWHLCFNSIEKSFMAINVYYWYTKRFPFIRYVNRFAIRLILPDLTDLDCDGVSACISVKLFTMVIIALNFFW